MEIDNRTWFDYFHHLHRTYGSTCLHCVHLHLNVVQEQRTDASPAPALRYCENCHTSVDDQVTYWETWPLASRLVWHQGAFGSYITTASLLDELLVPVEYLCFDLSGHTFMDYLLRIRRLAGNVDLGGLHSLRTVQERRNFCLARIQHFCQQVRVHSNNEADCDMALFLETRLAEYNRAYFEMFEQNDAGLNVSALERYEGEQSMFNTETLTQVAENLLVDRGDSESKVGVGALSLQARELLPEVTIHDEVIVAPNMRWGTWRFFTVTWGEDDEQEEHEDRQHSPENVIALNCTPCRLQEVPESVQTLVNSQCNVCFLPFQIVEDTTDALDSKDNVTLLMINKCQHLFHHDCVVPWLLKKRTCPLCRALIQ